MSILIKDMDMPTARDTLVLVKTDGTAIVYEDEAYVTTAVPVPPHGRLIDADALKEIILDYIEEYSWLEEDGLHNLKWCAMKEVEAVIDAAPTIIPADKEA